MLFYLFPRTLLQFKGDFIRGHKHSKYCSVTDLLWLGKQTIKSHISIQQKPGKYFALNYTCIENNQNSLAWNFLCLKFLEIYVAIYAKVLQYVFLYCAVTVFLYPLLPRILFLYSLLQVPLKKNTKLGNCGFLKYRLAYFLALSLSITSTLSPQ